MIGRQTFLTRRRRRESPVSPEVETGRNRLLITGILFSVAFSIVAIRLVDLTLFVKKTETRFSHSSAKNFLPANRADIIDRSGHLLATNLKTRSLYANPRLISNPQKVANLLAQILPNLDKDGLSKLFNQDRDFVWIQRHLTPKLQNKVNRLGLPGLNFIQEEKRVYPAGDLTAHLLGYTDTDNRGLAGIERHFDQDLRSRQNALKLSIDIRVQQIMRSTLKAAKTKFQAIGASGIVMDVQNGEVIAMVSLPDFDPHFPPGFNTNARFNRATLGVYEMGSTFKIFTAAMALDSGIITLKGGYDAKRPIRIGRHTIRDYHPKNRWLSVPEIFIHSSNIGAAKMAQDVGSSSQKNFLRKIGFLNSTSLEIPEIGFPITPGRWGKATTMTVGIGYGIAVSPIQLSAGVSAMVNGGIFFEPTLLKRSKIQTKRGIRVISKLTSKKIRRMLRLVVVRGTGRKAASPGYIVGGKTGTAEKVIGKKYKTKALISSFIGAFPMHSPRFVVFAMLDEPSGTKESFGYATGGWVAAPIVGSVISRIGPLLGVRPLDEKSPEIRAKLHLKIPAQKKG